MTSSANEAPSTESSVPLGATEYDAVVIGGGLGGLLAGLTLLKAGRSVLLLERFPHLGGRFSAVEHDGCHISTGALHLVPHGGDGVLASLLDQLGVAMSPVATDVIASFHLSGRHVLWRRPWDIFRLLSLQAKVDLMRIGFLLKLNRDIGGVASFRDWLYRNTKDHTIHLIFERFADFALSIPLEQIGYREMRAVFRSMSHFGLPAVPAGGCKGLTQRLATAIQEHGGTVAISTEATEIVVDKDGRATGVVAARRDGSPSRLYSAKTIVSDIGPVATKNLLRDEKLRTRLDGGDRVTANGLKLQILSDVSVIPHRGIMFCLDTRRISGIVQVTNAVPELAPSGKHLLNTFQVVRSDNIVEEKKLALADLNTVFGPNVTKRFRVIHSGVYRGQWPVNRRIQGQDERDQHPCQGLVMVGDAYKPTGLMMVEGVAASVQNVFSALTKGVHPPDALRVDNSVIRTGSGQAVGPPYLKLPHHPEF